jgi:transposase
MQVEETIGDCAFGAGATREEFEQAGRKLIARVPKRSNRGFFPKDDFDIDLEEMTCTCPAGQATDRLVRSGRQKTREGSYETGQAFCFDEAVCDVCELRTQCARAATGKGRTVSLHPQERLLQEARALQASPAFKEYQRMRQASEHRLGRMVQLGMRQARYFGRTGTLFQALVAAAVANLTLIGRKTGEIGNEGGARAKLHLFFSHLKGLFRDMIDHAFAQICSLTNISRLVAIPKPGFRPGL